MKRYQRQQILPQLGETGQQKLTQARVLVIGAGGLGCALLPYLVASGIGNIGIVDGDQIEESNLHRQILYSPEDLGKLKTEIAQVKLQLQNPDCNLTSIPEYLSGSNALALFNQYDLIVDATDRIAIRYLINDAALITGKPVVYGSIHRFEGQVSVFNYKDGPTYRCLFPKATAVPNCAEAGVLGTAVGLVGMLQAQEVMKILLETGTVLSGELLVYNCLTATQSKFQFTKKDWPHIDETYFCQTYLKDEKPTETFDNNLLKTGNLLDVREVYEQPRLAIENLIEIPLGELDSVQDNLSKESHYYVFCQSGKRALLAVNKLNELGFVNVVALHTGAAEIAESIITLQVK